MKNLNTIIFQQGKYAFAAICLLISNLLFSQESTDSLYQNIEVVKITKLLPKNKEKIETQNSDLLSHDAGKFLQQVPEISGIKKAGNYATDPVLRGFKYEQLNIVIDGASNAVNACPSRMDPAVSQVNMNMVKEVEIFKGPYHFRHGNALGGTINFITIPPVFSDKTNVNGRISLGYESNGNILRNEGFAQLSSKKIVWDVFGSYQKGDRYKDGNGNEVRSAFLRYNVGTKANFKWNENNTTNVQINSNQGRDVEFAALKMDLLFDKTWMVQLGHLAEFQNSLLKNINFNSYFSIVEHSMGTADQSMVSDVRTRTYGSRAEAKFAKNKNVFYSGFDYKHEEAVNISSKMTMAMPMMTDGTSWQNSHIDQLGWFGEYQHFFSNSKLTASLRLDYNEANAEDPSKLFTSLYGNMKADDFNHSLSLGYSYGITKNTQLALWMGRAQRSASLTERYINRFPVGADDYQYVGNPLLKPETNNQADLIFTHKKEKIYFQIDGFYSLMQDYISGVVRSDIKPNSMMVPGTRQFQNIEKAFRAGVEANFNWKFLPKYRTEMAVAYTYGEDLNTKNPLPEIAPLDFRWRMEADFSPVVFGFQYRFAATQKRINPEFGEFVTKDFSLLDFNAKYNVFNNAFLSFEVSNIFNRAYAEHLSRTLSGVSHQRILERGRSFNCAFTYRF
ncbi:TonB-dependent receptor [Flavobacteriaceae bacterium JJC]|nr:TonB-dependent receptor [Flavobacteriaceae bacterium JJC]